MSFTPQRKREVTQPIAYYRAGEQSESALLKMEVGSFFKNFSTPATKLLPPPQSILRMVAPPNALKLLPPTT
jgi:hypothetical protein